jgi:hypothetical protein
VARPCMLWYAISSCRQGTLPPACDGSLNLCCVMLCCAMISTGNAATQCQGACISALPLPTISGSLGADGMVSVLAHELAEAVTDPLGNAWFDSCRVSAGYWGGGVGIRRWWQAPGLTAAGWAQGWWWWS